MVPLKSSTFAVTRIYKLVVSVVTTHIVHSIRTVIVNGLTLKYTQYTSSNFGLILSYDLFIQFVLNTHPKLSKFTQCFASFLYKQLPVCWLNMLQFEILHHPAKLGLMCTDRDEHDFVAMVETLNLFWTSPHKTGKLLLAVELTERHQTKFLF